MDIADLAGYYAAVQMINLALPGEVDQGVSACAAALVLAPTLEIPVIGGLLAARASSWRGGDRVR